MAKDELLFDSDRQARRAQRQRRLIPILLGAAILLTILAVILIIRSGRKPLYNGGEDTPYPYTWQQQSDGSARLSISLGDAAGCRWTLADQEEFSNLTVSAAEVKKDETSFTLTPEQTGRALFTLVLRGPGDETDTRYRVVFLAEITHAGDGLAVELLSSTGTALQGRSGGGADSQNPYEFYLEEDGDLVLTVTRAGAEDWLLDFPQDQSAVTLLGLVTEEDQVTGFFRAGEEDGTCQLSLSSQEAGVTVTLEISNQGGALLVTSHNAVYASSAAASTESTESTGEAPADTGTP